MPKKPKTVSKKARQELSKLMKDVDTAAGRVQNSDKPAEESGRPESSEAAVHAATERRPADSLPTERFEQVPTQEDAADPQAGPRQEPPLPKRGPGRPPKTQLAPAPAATPGPAEPEFEITPELMSYGLDLLGQFNTMTVALVAKVPIPQAAEIWKFAEHEKKALVGPATKVANKHFPEWIKKYGDEFALLIVLLPILTAKIALTVSLRQAASRQDETKPDSGARATPNSSAGQPESGAHLAGNSQVQ